MGNALAKDFQFKQQEIKQSFLKDCVGKDAPLIPVELFGKQEQSATLKPILYSNELNYLNAHWGDWDPRNAIASHRPIIGKFIVRLKRFLVSLFFDNLFQSYFAKEREFQMQLVRHLNSSARYIDGRNKELFWQLIGKIDQEAAHLTERCDYLYFNCLATNKMSSIELKKEIIGLQENIAALKQFLTKLKADV
ncbi:MAG: hypothetical protein IT292_10365 [Deltaproteobacteria bacterium]|nr:hypothetical protein [Deltaproteobacteria bacterium]